MLIVDEATAKRQARAKVVERTRELTYDGVRNATRDSKWVADKERSVANVDRQSGHRLTPDQFMRKLNSINPDIELTPHPGVFAPKDSQFHKLNRDKAVLNLNVGGKHIFLLVCEGDWMPEWTIFGTKEEMEPDGEPERPWRKVTIPWNRQKRGWREVLIMLIRKRIVGLEAVERIFGAGDRPSWKILTGKGTGDSIF